MEDCDCCTGGQVPGKVCPTPIVGISSDNEMCQATVYMDNSKLIQMEPLITKLDQAAGAISSAMIRAQW